MASRAPWPRSAASPSPARTTSSGSPTPCNRPPHSFSFPPPRNRPSRTRSTRARRRRSSLSPLLPISASPGSRPSPPPTTSSQAASGLPTRTPPSPPSPPRIPPRPHDPASTSPRRNQCDSYGRCGAFGVCNVVDAVVCGAAAASGCIQWFGDLVDTRFVDEGQDLYVRLAKSELASR